MPTKKNKSKQKKSRTRRAKHANKALLAKPAGKPGRSKKAAKKKHSSTQTAKARMPRKRKTSAREAQAPQAHDVLSGRQAGDLEGLSRTEQADSESVAELVEEGNPFEAGTVAGVEEADSEDEREVHTHEVPEDDVPEEYLDKD
jgi:hypothetical protein